MEELIPDGRHIYDHYTQFVEELPEFCRHLQLTPNDLIFRDYVSVIEGWTRTRNLRAPVLPDQ